MIFNEYQKTKIIATLGPASSSFDQMLALSRAGVDVFRLNFSHGKHEDYRRIIKDIKDINEQEGNHIGILADLQGPKLRVGEIENGSFSFEKDDILTFVNEKCIGTKEKVYMSYNCFASDVKIGETILVDDGKLQFEVIETNGTDTVKLKAKFGGELKSNKGVNLPNTDISLPALTEKDLKDLDFILTQDVNWIALSFVRSHKDVKQLKGIIKSRQHPAKVIAKIEKPQAITNLKKIIKETNAVMVARGDLGIEVPMEQLPTLQKEIINACVQRSRPVIVATQMMESMISNPTPTRAEITDVANAVLDGADAVMLSGETSVGKYPLEVIEAMAKIIIEAEKSHNYAIHKPKASPKSSTYLSDVVCYRAAQTASIVNAKGIIGITKSGYTAFRVSSYRPNTHVFIFSDDPHILNTLNLVWGVRCFRYDRFTSTDETIEDTIKILKEQKVITTGDIVINTGSMPLQKRLRTNMMKVTVVE